MISAPSSIVVCRWLALLLVTLLVSCGSGVGSGGSGVPAGVQTGTVNGFGSVIVDSTAYDDNLATVSVDLDGESGTSLTSDDIRLGMQVRLAFEQDAVAQSIEINPQLIGSVESVASDELVVAGQTVTVVSRGARPTVFSGFDQLAALNAGDRVTIFGLFGEFGRLYATRIELGASAPQGLAKISGTINFFGLLRRTLRIGNQTISVDRNTPTDIPLIRLRIGDLVSVWVNETGARIVEARRIELEDPRPAIGTVRRFIGFVRQAPVDGVAVIGRNRVDVASAVFPNGSAADLTPGRLVLVGAQVVDRQLQANTVTLLDLDREDDVSVAGTVSELTVGVSLEVRNTRADISAPDLIFVGGTVADLVDGAQVLVRGTIVDGQFRVRQIEFAS